MRHVTTLFIALSLVLPVGAAARFVAPTLRELNHRKGENKAVVGIVERLFATAHVQRGGKGQRSDLALGMRIFEDDRVSTERSRTHIRYKDGTYVELGEDTVFDIDRMRFKPANPLPQSKLSVEYDESVFRFVQGVARIAAGDVHPLNQFTVKTSNAIIKVVGPADFYLIQLEGDRDLTVKVARGKLELMNAVTNEKVTVEPGTGAYVKVSGLVTNAGQFTSDQLNFLKSRTRI